MNSESNILKDHSNEGRGKVFKRVLKKHFKNIHPLLKDNPHIGIYHFLDNKFFSPNSKISLISKDGENVIEDLNEHVPGTADSSIQKRIFRDKFDLNLDMLYLKKKYRSKGIGKAVQKAWRASAEEMGISNMEFMADDEGRYIWPKMEGVEWDSMVDKLHTNLKYRIWLMSNDGPKLGINAKPGDYPTEFLKNHGGLFGVGMLDYKIPLEKKSAFNLGFMNYLKKLKPVDKELAKALSHLIKAMKFIK